MYSRLSPSDTLFYFAFGSNMSSKTQKWRNIKFTQKKSAILYNYKLTFDLQGFPFSEGGWGNIKSQIGECVHGVIMEMKKQDFQSTIKDLEGPEYQIIDVQVEDYEGKCFDAIALHVPEKDGKYFYPSKRYLDLLVSGAEENELKEDYVAFLKEFPHSQENLTLLGTILKWWFMLFYVGPIFLFFLLRNCKKRLNPILLHRGISITFRVFSFVPKLIHNNLPRKWFYRSEKEPESLKYKMLVKRD